MSTEQRPPFGQTTTGVILIQGLLGPVVGAIVGVFVTLALTQPNDQRWRVAVIVAAVIAAATFLLTSLISKQLRTIIWGRLGSWLKRISLRLTTVKRQEAAARAAGQRAVLAARNDAQKTGYKLAVDRLKPSMEESAKKIKQVTADRDRLQIELDDFRESVKWRGQTYATPNPSIPLPEPRWAVVVEDGSRESELVLRLINRVKRSYAKEVRLEVLEKFFTFTSGAQWEDMSGESSEEFTGTVTRAGMHEGVPFQVSWYTPEGANRVETAKLPRLLDPPPDYHVRSLRI